MIFSWSHKCLNVFWESPKCVQVPLTASCFSQSNLTWYMKLVSKNFFFKKDAWIFPLYLLMSPLWMGNIRLFCLKLGLCKTVLSDEFRITWFCVFIKIVLLSVKEYVILFPGLILKQWLHLVFLWLINIAISENELA